MTQFRTILLDCPWPQSMSGNYKKHAAGKTLPYPSMSIDELANLPINSIADTNCICWLWTTNQFLRAGFDVLDAWGFKYLNAVCWVKPSGYGNWFVGRTQSMLVGYRGKLDMKTRFKPNVLFASARRHSQKPECSYELIECVSHEPRVELFARQPRPGWTTLGNGIDGRDIRDAINDLSNC